MNNQIPTLREYMQAYTDRRLNYGSSRSRSRVSTLSNNSDRQLQQFFRKQLEFKQQLEKLKKDIQPFLTNQNEKIQFIKKMDKIYHTYLRDTQFWRYRIKSQGSRDRQELLSPQEEKISDYYHKLRALRSKTAENVQKTKNSRVRIPSVDHEQKVDLGKYKQLRQKSSKALRQKQQKKQ